MVAHRSSGWFLFLLGGVLVVAIITGRVPRYPNRLHHVSTTRTPWQERPPTVSYGSFKGPLKGVAAAKGKDGGISPKVPTGTWTEPSLHPPPPRRRLSMIPTYKCGVVWEVRCGFLSIFLVHSVSDTTGGHTRVVHDPPMGRVYFVGPQHPRQGGKGRGSDVLERPYTVGGGGGNPPPPWTPSSSPSNV